MLSRHSYPLIRTFRVSVFWWITMFSFLFVLFSLSLGIALFILLTQPILRNEDTANVLFMLSSFAFAMLIIIFSIYKAIVYGLLRLTLSSEGITLHAPGLQMFTPWQNISGITMTTWGIIPTKGLHLKQPASREIGIGDGMRLGVSVLNSSWWNSWWVNILYRRTLPIPLIVQKSLWSQSQLETFLSHRSFE